MATFQIAKLVATLVLEDSGFKGKANEAKKSSDDLFGSLKQGVAVLGTVAAAFAVAKKVFDLGKEGAQIETMRGRFENWSKAIGTTSDALMKDLRTATKGMYSDAQLVESATNFMSLGLAKTHDQAVRLSKVAGALNMNMNQLVLTLTNKTTMRFDAIGVSVDGFDEKVKALKETMGDDAFTEAFLQQAERQIEITGDAAETTAGQFAMLEADIQNSTNALKEQVATALLPLVKAYNENVGAATEYYETLEKVAEAQGISVRELRMMREEGQALVDEYIRAEQYGLAWEAVLGSQTTAIQALNDEMTTFGFKNEELAGLVGQVSSENKRYTLTAEELRLKQIELLAEKKKLIGQGYSPEGTSIKDVNKKLEENAELMDENKQKHKEWVNSKIGDLLLMKLNQDGLSDAELSYYLNFLTTSGQITQADKKLTMDIIANADQQVAAFDETTEAIDHTEIRLHNLMMRAQTARQQAALPIVYNVEINVRGSFPRPPNDMPSPSNDTGGSPNPGRPGRATGGPVLAGRAYDTVELRRPEVFTPNTSGRIDPVKEQANQPLDLSDRTIRKLVEGLEEAVLAAG